MFCPEETVIVITGTSATGVRLGNGVKEDAPEEIGVLGCGSNEVLVTEGKDGMVDVKSGPGIFGCGEDVRELIKGGGVLVRGCKR